MPCGGTPGYTYPISPEYDTLDGNGHTVFSSNALMPMKITRLYTGPDNHSCFDDIEIPLESKGPLGLFTEPMGAKAVFFREIPPGYEYPWHNVVC
ncbi:MAG: hypothetical protein PHF57_06860, partial [Methanoregula sp.]|nr:hypothetical protein [Methanoregula sp.]